MAKRPILCLPDPRLRAVSQNVGAVDDSVRALMDDMLETMYDAPGIGLAAIQIGVPKRVIVIDLARRTSRRRRCSSPIPRSSGLPGDSRSIEEGCLSMPEYYEEVSRPAEVRVRFLDRDGKRREIEAEGLLATCIQHEIDHLNGILFIDHLSRLKRERVIKKFRKLRASTSRSVPRAPEIRAKLGASSCASFSWARRISRCRR